MTDTLRECPWGCTAKHGLTKGQRDMHGDLNQNYAVWCDHAKMIGADRDLAFNLWNTRHHDSVIAERDKRIAELEGVLDEVDEAMFEAALGEYELTQHVQDVLARKKARATLFVKARAVLAEGK